MIASKLANTFNFTGLSDLFARIRDRTYGKKIAFIHVPKCGGTSLSHCLRLKYTFSHFKLDEHAVYQTLGEFESRDWMNFKQKMLIYQLEKGTALVQAHAPINQQILRKYSDRYHFITLLRNPVERAISQYHFDTRLKRLSPEELKSNHRFSVESNILLHFFGELEWQKNEDFEKHAQIAIKNLNAFTVVGALNNPDQIERDFKRKLNMNISIPRRNVNTAKGNKASDEELMRLFKDSTKNDKIVFDSFGQNTVN